MPPRSVNSAGICPPMNAAGTIATLTMTLGMRGTSRPANRMALASS